MGIGSHRLALYLLMGWVSALAALVLSAPAQAAYEHSFSFGELGSPHGIAFGPDGNVYVADQDNDRVRVYAPDGAHLRDFGSSGSANGELSAPRGIAVSAEGEVYVVDRLNQRVQVFSSSGGYLRKWGAVGTGPARFNSPGWIDLDAAGNVYVTDTFNYRVQIFTPQGAFLGQFGSQGSGPGQFSLLSGIEVTSSGVYVADHEAARLQLFTVDGVYVSELGGLSHPGLLGAPWGMAEDSSETLLVADLGVATGTSEYGARRISRDGVLLDSFGPLGTGPGEFSQPRDVAVAENGDAYVTDTDANQVKVFARTQGVGPQTAIDSGPGGPINVTQATFTFSSPTAEAAFECSLDGGMWASCASPLTLTALGSGDHRLAVRAVAAGIADETPAVRTFAVDLQSPPPPAIDTDVADPTSSPAATFALSGEPEARIECRLDQTGFEVCGSVRSYAGLSEGLHTFEARQVDLAGNVGEAAARSWRVDLTPPETAITSGPAQWVTTSSVSFLYAAGEPGATFACSLDGAATACGAGAETTLSGLGEGPHIFAVRAVDAAGNADPQPAEASFTVDTVAPAVTISEGPAPEDSSTTARFLYSAGEAGITFECRLDGCDWSDCPATGRTYDSLALGDHTFHVRGRDGAGNSSEPASHAWRVVANAPPTAAAQARMTRKRFRYILDGAGSVDADGSIVGYEWRVSKKRDVAGAVVSVAPSFKYRVAWRRAYVTLTVTDDDGATGSDAITLRGPD